MKRIILLMLGTAVMTTTACRKKDSNNVTPSSSSTSSSGTSSGSSTGGSSTGGSSTGGGSTASKTGTIQFVNNSSNPYELYINGTYKGVAMGKKVVSYTVNEGYYSCRVLQQSGYVLYPTDKTYTGTVTANKIAVVSFP